MLHPKNKLANNLSLSCFSPALVCFVALLETFLDSFFLGGGDDCDGCEGCNGCKSVLEDKSRFY
jgi:hypothetical protein